MFLCLQGSCANPGTPITINVGNCGGAASTGPAKVREILHYPVLIMITERKLKKHCFLLPFSPENSKSPTHCPNLINILHFNFFSFDWYKTVGYVSWVRIGEQDQE